MIWKGDQKKEQQKQRHYMKTAELIERIDDVGKIEFVTVKVVAAEIAAFLAVLIIVHELLETSA